MNVRYQLPEKETIRKSMLQMRRGYYAGKYATVRRQYEAALRALPEISQTDHILLYASFDNEVDTFDIIKHLLADGKKVYLPHWINGKDPQILPLESMSDLSRNELGIYEPPDNIGIDINLITAAIIPGVAFDQSGYRLGYGQGFYDKLLENYHGPMIGLAYSWQVIPELPHEPHDVRLNILITDKEVWRFDS